MGTLIGRDFSNCLLSVTFLVDAVQGTRHLSHSPNNLCIMLTTLLMSKPMTTFMYIHFQFRC